jgi:hypothetical protein
VARPEAFPLGARRPAPPLLRSALDTLLRPPPSPIAEQEQTVLRPSLLVVALALCRATTLHAQAVKVAVEVDLSFPPVLTGVPVTVQPGGSGSGRFRLASANGKSTSVQLTFTLSGALLMGGQSIPISFGPGSVGFSQSVTGAAMIPLDPRTPQTVTLGSNGEGYVFIGGTITPSTSQMPGTYTTTISIQTR